MKAVLIAMNKIANHLYRNLSNYLLLSGVCCILSYVYTNYGFQTCLLTVGVLLVIASIIVELNSKKR